MTYCGVGIQKAQLYEARVREYRQNQLLLNLAKSLFQEQTSLDRLITNIIVEAKKMLKCERCTIFLLDLKMYDQVVKIKMVKMFDIYKLFLYQIEQDAWNVKESLALLASTAATNNPGPGSGSANCGASSGRFVPGELTVRSFAIEEKINFWWFFRMIHQAKLPWEISKKKPFTSRLLMS